MRIATGEIKISVWLEDVIGLEQDYFLPRFEKVLVKGVVREFSFMGTAFDCYLILSYESVDDLLEYLKIDMGKLRTVILRNKKRLLPRSDINERMIMNATCVMGRICDNYVAAVKRGDYKNV